MPGLEAKTEEESPGVSNKGAAKTACFVKVRCSRSNFTSLR